MSRWSLPFLGLGLAVSLSACVSSGNPTDLIPVGLRTTFGAEDRNANPQKPMTAEQLLAKLRGEPIPSSPEPAAPSKGAVAQMPMAMPMAGGGMPPIPSSWTQAQGGGGAQQMQSPPSREPAKEEESRPALVEVTLRFDGAATEPRAEDGLRVQLAASRAAKLGAVAATIKVGPTIVEKTGADKIASLSLAMKRGEAVRALLPEPMAKTAQVAYAPSVEAGSARFDLR